MTRDTIRNPEVLKVRQLPRKIFGRVTVWPRRMGVRRFLRIVIEFQALRYSIVLLPLICIALIWNGAALPLSQAPILMLFMIWWVEMRVLRVPEKKRKRLIDAAEADRGVDLLRAQGRAVLMKIAALRGIKAGKLHLIVEQSELWAFAPLTYVSVQSEDGPKVLDLNAAEREVVREGLFQGALTERLLLRINQSQNVFLRDIAFDARGVTAHARLEAALAG